MRKVILIVFLCFIKTSLGQDLPILIPNSPEATEFVKYGNTNVNLYTGSPDIKIPIYSIEGKEFNLPISLNYDASGIKVNQIATQVGLAWSLQAGGMISRITNGKPDHVIGAATNYFGSYYTEYDKIKAFYDTSPIENVVYQPVNPLYLTTLSEYFQYEEEILSGIIDTQPDYFSFNVGSISGTIYIDPITGEARCDNGNNYIINYVGSLTNFSGGGITNWHIVDEFGNQYFFDKYDTIKTIKESNVEKYISTWHLTKIISANGIDNLTFNHSLSDFWENEKYVPTAASMVSNLINPNLTVSSSCPLVNSNVNNNTNPYQIQQYYLTSISLNGETLISFYQDNQERKDLSSRYALNKISIANGIDYEFHQSYFKSHPTVDINNITVITQDDIRLKLDSLTIKPKLSGGLNKKYKFDYFNPDDVPNLQSFSQDAWGYYNGAPNTGTYGLVPEKTIMVGGVLQSFPGANRNPDFEKGKNGTLSKITYPTGGHTEFEYELHKVNITEQTIVNNNILLGSLFGGNDLSDPYDYWDDEYFYDNPKGAEFVIPVYEDGNKEITIDYNSPSLPHGPGDNDPGILFIAMLKCTGTPPEPNNCGGIPQIAPHGCPIDLDWYDIVNYPQSEKVFIRSYPGGNYSTAIPDGYTETISVDLDEGYYKLYILNGVTNSYLGVNMTFASEVNQTHDKDVGGLRIKKIKDYTEYNASPSLIKSYAYSNTVDDACGNPVAASSGLLHFNPQFSNYSYYTGKTVDESGFLLNKNCSFLNRYSIPLNTSKSNHIAYSTVHEYVVDVNGGNNGHTEYYFYNDIEDTSGLDPSIPYLKSNFKNGKILKQLIYNNSNILKQKIINTYTQTEVNNAVKGFKSMQGVYTEDKELGIINLVGGDQKYKMYEPTGCGNGTSGYTLCYQYSFPPPSVIYGDPFINKIHSIYYMSGFFAHLSKSEVTHYHETDSLKTTINYYYDGLNQSPKTHRQVSRTITTNSDGKSLLTKTYFPDDVVSTSSLDLNTLNSQEKMAIDKLKLQNNKAMPIQTNTYNDINTNGLGEDTELISAQRTNFIDLGGVVLTESIQTLKGVYNSSSNILEDRVKYLQYDNYGNPVEVSKADGTIISYCWGYDGKYPIAKIENATYNSVLSALVSSSVSLQNLTNADDDHCIDGGGCNEEALRSGLQSLREAMPNALVSTYTYDPLIGMTSATDPSGYTTFYIYDEFNRLMMIKDSNGNVTKENKYNYGN
ncbi:RHS repeat domain-containing protein [Aestuariibaculum sediminum]|uniref:RHS repeat protein n=1 Tax=Aestuariibaculum sediminum TaxID=2770637 RepID=A0A8J6Q2T3_9FLAO|nr:RHS repeat domain-containing protein [Aestuariibaculum sediminum]MBD0833797.1 RHS repeat protein [Aestuariibaculum sediminum]